MKMPKGQIGVVVPTMNSASTLQWTLCSLRSQRDITLDVIVADSGSQDGTVDICKAWGVPTIYVPPGNMYRAINAGLRVMESDWVTYLNSDDIVYPDSYAGCYYNCCDCCGPCYRSYQSNVVYMEFHSPRRYNEGGGFEMSEYAWIPTPEEP